MPFPAVGINNLEDIIFFIQNKEEIFAVADEQLYQYVKSDVVDIMERVGPKRQEAAFLIGAAEQITDAKKITERSPKN